MTYDMIIRKKALKIQERLGMRIGIPYGLSNIGAITNLREGLAVLRELYKIGVKAFVLPPELFKGIANSTDLYKTAYGDLIKLKEEAKKYNIELALHHPRLPPEPDEALRLFCSIYTVMDCRSFIIHPSFYSKIMPADQALRLAVHKINEIVNSLKFRVNIGIETTGRINEVGTIEDVIDMVKRTTSTEPVLNWGHIHARHSGALRSQSDYISIVEKVKGSIGQKWLSDAYFFFSGVSYGPSGEKDHVPLARADIKLEDLIRTIMKYGIKGTLIFEDPDREKFILKVLDNLADMVR